MDLLRLQSELFFVNKKNKYVWDETVQLFRKLRNIDEGLNQSDFFKMQVFGENETEFWCRYEFMNALW